MTVRLYYIPASIQSLSPPLSSLFRFVFFLVLLFYSIAFVHDEGMEQGYPVLDPPLESSAKKCFSASPSERDPTAGSTQARRPE